MKNKNESLLYFHTTSRLRGCMPDGNIKKKISSNLLLINKFQNKFISILVF